MAPNITLPKGHTGTPDTFYLPESFYHRHGIPDMIPGYVKPHVLLLKDERDLNDLAAMAGGRAEKPTKQVILYGADGHTCTVIPGMGVTEAAELEDIARETWENQRAKIARNEPVINFKEYREKHGYPKREEFDAFFREALRERMRKHRANPVSDPAPVRINKPKENVYAFSKRSSTVPGE